MLNINAEICFEVRKARRAAKLSQSELAAEIGCKQSALSMFEQGQPTKLGEESVVKLAEKFHIDLKGGGAKATSAAAPSYLPPVAPPAEVLVRGFCPNPHCPTNAAYAVDGRTLFLPDRAKADPVGGVFCAYCGERLEKRCPNCGAPVHDGAICSLCGEPYLSV